MRLATAGSLAVGLLLLPALGHAQDRGREGRRRFDPAEMLRGMDTNKNGRIDPNELSGQRMGFFVRGAAQRAGMDLNQSLPIDKLAEAMQQPRDGDRGRYGDRDRDRDDRRRDDNDDDRRSDRDGPGSSSSSQGSGSTPAASVPASTPGVVGFGAPAAPAGGSAVMGFGAAAGQQRFSQRTADYVEDMLQRYDTNKDTFVDSNEWKVGRWSTPPEESDTNKDNRLSKEELMVRIAKRFGEDSSSASSSGSSASSAQQFSTYGAQSLLKQYDKNSDGKLEREEWQAMPSQHHSADTNNDGTITTEELTAKVATFATGTSTVAATDQISGFGGSSGSIRRFRSPVERLPTGLPSWFLEKDADQDGQVMMSEFASSWSESTASEFARSDLNNDGFITAKECLRAATKR